jgi:hypothetical protein
MRVCLIESTDIVLRRALETATRLEAVEAQASLPKGITKMNYILAAAFTVLLASSAFAADISKAQETAEFRVKAAVCKAQSKEAGIKQTTPDFYSYMADCVDRVSVAVNITPSAPAK